MAERCGHCGREGTRETKETVSLSEETHVQRVGNYVTEVGVTEFAQLDRCSACGKLSLSTYWWAEEFMDPDDVKVHELYPEQRDLSDLPERVKDRYSAMLELQHAPDAFAVRAGKLLETVCTDQGVKRNNQHPDLADRLDVLVERGDVPRSLADQAHLVRRYRNLGGHDAAMEVGEQDVPLIRKFVEGLLDFLYWGPANLTRVTAEFQTRKEEAERTS